MDCASMKTRYEFQLHEDTPEESAVIPWHFSKECHIPRIGEKLIFKGNAYRIYDIVHSFQECEHTMVIQCLPEPIKDEEFSFTALETDTAFI